jgi:hypothetical protein
MESNAAPLAILPSGEIDQQQQRAMPSEVSIASVQEKFLSLLRGYHSPAEIAFGIVSTVQQVIRLQLGAMPRGDNFEEFFHELAAPAAIQKAFRDLYDNSRGYLFGLVSQDTDTIVQQPSTLWLEELEELIGWTERRRHHLQLSSSYRLAEEGFFNSKVLSDVVRQQECGAVIKTCLNLDSRGAENLFLTVKILWRGMPVKTADTYAGWSEADTEHWLYELPLQTKGSRLIGRTIVDDIDIFIPYCSVHWGQEFLDRKTADVTYLVSVLDRTGAVVLSERLPGTLRVMVSDGMQAVSPVRSPMETGLAEVCPLKGHRMEQVRAWIEDDMLKVNASLTVFGVAFEDLQFDIRILDSRGVTMHEEFYTLKPVTNIARFSGLGTAITLQDLQLQHGSAVMPQQVELVIAQDDSKVLCGSVVIVEQHQ